MTKNQKKTIKEEICLHEKHLTPEFVWDKMWGTSRPSGLILLLKERGMIADKCVDCGKDISNLNLLKAWFS